MIRKQKVFDVSCSTNLVFCILYFSKMKRKPTKTIFRYDAFHVKESLYAKNKLNPARNENQPKKPDIPLLYESLQLAYTLLYIENYLLTCTRDMHHFIIGLQHKYMVTLAHFGDISS